MSYVIYHNETTVLIPIRYSKKSSFGELRHAKAAITRAEKKHSDFNRNHWSIADGNEYRENIERQVERINMMSGKPYMESVNTPAYMSPACESYWSM